MNPARFYEFFVLLALFLAHSAAYECKGKTFTALQGSFTSPNYPRTRPSDGSCDYSIKAKKGHYVEITINKSALKFPFNNIKTDYLWIFDGKEHNRQQEVYLDGAITTPLKFTSRTSRVFMTFVSDRNFALWEFTASYKMLPQHRCAAILEINHGKAKCNRDRFGEASYCEVKCNPTYKLKGHVKSFCQNDEFVDPPSCVPDPAYHCDMDEIKNLNAMCVSENPASFVSECSVTCDYPYLLLGNDTFTCNDGEWSEVPECFPDPDVIEACENNSQFDCPFTTEETEEYQQAYFDELGTVKTLVVARTNERYLHCPEKLCCKRRSTKKHVYQCEPLSYKMQKRKRMTEKQRKYIMIHCFRCQANSCTPIGFFN